MCLNWNPNIVIFGIRVNGKLIQNITNPEDLQIILQKFDDEITDKGYKIDISKQII